MKQWLVVSATGKCIQSLSHLTSEASSQTNLSYQQEHSNVKQKIKRKNPKARIFGHSSQPPKNQKPRETLMESPL
jgi:flagellar biogenesis protein FliO